MHQATRLKYLFLFQKALLKWQLIAEETPRKHIKTKQQNACKVKLIINKNIKTYNLNII